MNGLNFLYFVKIESGTQQWWVYKLPLQDPNLQRDLWKKKQNLNVKFLSVTYSICHHGSYNSQLIKITRIWALMIVVISNQNVVPLKCHSNAVKKWSSKCIRKTIRVCAFQCVETNLSQRGLSGSGFLCQLVFQDPDLFGISLCNWFPFCWQATC